MLYKNYLETLTCVAWSLEGTGTQTHVCKVKGKRFLREKEVLQGSKYIFSEGEEWGEGKCR